MESNPNLLSELSSDILIFMNDEHFMREALKEAKIAGEEGNWPMGCVVVINGEIVAHAHNTGYTENNRLAHAELKALVEARKVLETAKGQAVLYTTYEPCPMCFGAIVMMKIGRVVTGVDLDQSGCLDMKNNLPSFFQQPKFQFEITRGILAEECARIFKEGRVGEKHLSKLTK